MGDFHFLKLVWGMLQQYRSNHFNFIVSALLALKWKDPRKTEINTWHLSLCGGLALAGCQIPTKVPSVGSSSDRQGRENNERLKDRKNHSPITVIGKPDNLGENSLIDINQSKAG